jgi:hypothetical protein
MKEKNYGITSKGQGTHSTKEQVEESDEES